MATNDRRSKKAPATDRTTTNRSVIVTLTGDGDLVWSGQDLGPDVGALRPGASEYEWWRTVLAADVPRLLAALGGSPGDDVVKMVADRFTSDVELKEFADSVGIETEFDSWIRAEGE